MYSFHAHQPFLVSLTMLNRDGNMDFARWASPQACEKNAGQGSELTVARSA